MTTVPLSETACENSNVLPMCCTPDTGEVRSKKQSNNSHVKRPLNRFMLFSKLQRPRIRERYPHMNQKLISELLGKEWKSLSPAEQQEYEKKADNLKHRHKTEFPGYKYHPKRRGTSTNKQRHVSEGLRQIRPAPPKSPQKPHKRSSTSPELTEFRYIVFNNNLYKSTNIPASRLESIAGGIDEPPMFTIQIVRPDESTDSSKPSTSRSSG